ncbi:PilE-like protein [Elusimicrobium minutum Pei191]|uniref:PilE-like protein n=1 Tax=Elusimicrobium minutum (strain Pei191) TaxID=445932 RepID=B2KBY6_ELUMP|nr:prepilin-type N-terminal cleavage/methylation domain-containing protein [Elusimicrobium minutum]ACC97890.1 PilE-like protein [Elusimicrobium minutum Pei191]
MKKGFTLIELLVVVLIIGILAAIALPQYNKAVARSRSAEMLLALKAINTAQKAHVLATGSFAKDYGELSIEFPGCNYQTVSGTISINYLKCNKFTSVIETTGRAIFIGPYNGSNMSLSLNERSTYILYTPLATDEVICRDGNILPVKPSCKDIGFTKAYTGNSCFWGSCYTQ